MEAYSNREIIHSFVIFCILYMGAGGTNINIYYFIAYILSWIS
jgi:hypothetical protein